MVFQQKADKDNAFYDYKKNTRGMLEINALSEIQTTE